MNPSAEALIREDVRLVNRDGNLPLAVGQDAYLTQQHLSAFKRKETISEKKSHSCNDDDDDHNGKGTQESIVKHFGKVSERQKETKYQVRRGSNEKLEWYDKTVRKFVPAVYHKEIRHILIAQEASKGTYIHPRASGNHPDDVTAFLASQKDWGSDREHWPEILCQFQPLQVDVTTGQSRVGVKYLCTKRGEMIIGLKNRPLYDVRGLPLAISSAVESAFLEAWSRSNRQINWLDIRDRMPEDCDRFGNGGKVSATLLSNAAAQFRLQAGCLNWSPKSESGERMNMLLIDLLPNPYKDMNSTKGFRNLEEHEILKMNLIRLEGSTRQKTAYEKRLAEYKEVKAEYEARQRSSGGQAYVPTKPDTVFQPMMSSVEGDDLVENLCTPKFSNLQASTSYYQYVDLGSEPRPSRRNIEVSTKPIPAQPSVTKSFGENSLAGTYHAPSFRPLPEWTRYYQDIRAGDHPGEMANLPVVKREEDSTMTQPPWPKRIRRL